MSNQIARLPSDFFPELTDARLSVIAEALLNVYFDTHAELTTELDCNYTRGTATFGRMKNKLIAMHRSGLYADWFDLRNTSNDLTCAIAGIPFRFFRDDHESPTKSNFWRRNPQDDMFADDDDQPVQFRLVIEDPLNEEDEVRAYFCGFSQTQALVCVWQYQGTVRTLHSIDGVRPPSEDQPAPVVRLRDSESEAEKHTDHGGDKRTAS